MLTVRTVLICGFRAGQSAQHGGMQLPVVTIHPSMSVLHLCLAQVLRRKEPAEHLGIKGLQTERTKASDRSLGQEKGGSTADSLETACRWFLGRVSPMHRLQKRSAAV